MSEHSEFIELCAFYVSGSISAEQLHRLDQHLETCSDCRRALEEFQEIASMGLPSLAPEFAALPAHADVEASEERAQQRLFARIKNEIALRQPSTTAVIDGQACSRKKGRRLLRYVANLLPYAAALLMTVSVGFYSYHIGTRAALQPKLRQSQTLVESLAAENVRIAKERSQLRLQLDDSSSRMASLKAELESRRNEIVALKDQSKQLAHVASTSEARSASSEVELSDLARKIADAQASYEALQKNLDALRTEHNADLVRIAELEKRLIDAAENLKDRDLTIQQQRDLLAYDRDIRDLIGARDLYVAEVSDVDRDAQTKTPFGRVFYTKGKSLIFYAYDLDRQPGVKHASAFQAWGRRGPDFQQALPLGILYLDGSSKRRWVLRLDDAKTIAQIDAVFVTVEPQGGSHKPSGKPLLFAYLRVAPNHP